MIACANARGRYIAVLIFVLVASSLVVIHLQLGRARDFIPRLEGSQTASESWDHKPPTSEKNERFHLLLLASNQEVNLCKTLITSTVLDYPTPTLIAWNETFDKGNLLGGGSHVAKITGVLAWLDTQPATADADLVLMMDAYGSFDSYDNPGNKQAHLEADIWFQLRKETFLARYHSINRAADHRLEERLGSAFEAEGLRQTIVFGAGKRCAPNQVHTVACYPVPESPLPEDVYGANTDTIMGRNKYTSLRQRYLNSGYVIGPVRDMRRLFRRAQEKVEALKDHLDWDNGSGGSDFMYHGSDQSIFNTILGEQEFQREVMRRRHLTAGENAAGAWKRAPTWIEGTLIDDPLNPSFTHEPVEHKEGKPDEFGIGLDYFSELGQQTVNSEEDAQYIRHDVDIAEQVRERTGLFDCPNRASSELPEDILRAKGPMSGDLGWSSVPLYTNLCLNTIPALIHHNGDKGQREFAWPKMWIQSHARALMSSVLAGGEASREIAHTTDGRALSWGELCPRELERELFRDVEG